MVPVLMLFMVALVAAESDSASVSVVHCDTSTYCPDGTTCCLNPSGSWGCCPYPRGQCCRDGLHCCPNGYLCDSTSTHCQAGWLRLPSSSRLALNAIQETQSLSFDQALKQKSETEQVHCDGNVYCPTEQFCCKTSAGQWGCCSGLVL
ncbi:progranulin-like [Carassius carassius]|uniref:progranulin-like n=1 Tax=Carassius carassius TaxID=217509 RepID=UPI002869181F|nr:progranulin-like [Carassius carassius]